MSAPTRVFVDTAVLLHAEDGADAERQRDARDWLRVLWQRRCGRLSAQVLVDFYTTATRRLRPPMPAGDARAEVRRYRLWQPWLNDHATLETAWAVETRFGLSVADALIVAAALHQGCALLLSPDLAHTQPIDGLRIVNPFLIGPELLDTPP